MDFCMTPYDFLRSNCFLYVLFHFLHNPSFNNSEWCDVSVCFQDFKPQTQILFFLALPCRCGENFVFVSSVIHENQRQPWLFWLRIVHCNKGCFFWQTFSSNFVPHTNQLFLIVYRGWCESSWKVHFLPYLDKNVCYWYVTGLPYWCKPIGAIGQRVKKTLL